MHRGYIKIYRKIRDNAMWNIKPFSKIQAFIDILMDANHVDKTVVFRDQEIQCQRGQYITSILKLSEKWGWSRSKAKSYLNMIQQKDIIRYNIYNKRYIIITIWNYDIYNPIKIEKEQQIVQQKDNRPYNRKTTERQQKDITNNYNNEKELNTTRKKFDKDSYPYILSKYQYDCIKENDPGFIFLEKEIQKNAVQMDYLIRLDKRDPDEIRKVLNWIKEDDFNRPIVLSSKKLRKRYVELRQKWSAIKKKSACAKKPIDIGKPRIKSDNFSNESANKIWEKAKRVSKETNQNVLDVYKNLFKEKG